MTAYRIAIEYTTQVIEKRARYFRNLVVLVTGISLGSMLWAAITWRWFPFIGMLLLPPVCILYLYLDARLLDRWRHDCFVKWIQTEIDFRALHTVLSAISALPRGTVQSMLETLPMEDDLERERSITSGTREAMAAILTAIYTCRSDMQALKAAGFTLTGYALLLAVAFRMWPPLLGLSAACLAIVLQKRIKTRRVNWAGTRIATVRQLSGFNPKKVLEFSGRIQRTPLSAAEMESILAPLSDAFEL